MTTTVQNRQYEVLLVEDNPGDVRLVMEILAESNLTRELHVAYDGEEAIDLMLGRNHTAGDLIPDLVLLDLNLPKRNGLEVLKAIRSRHNFNAVPVVVFTSSEAESDVRESYRLQANAYVTKPVDFDEFSRVIKTIEHFWLSIVNLP